MQKEKLCDGPGEWFLAISFFWLFFVITFFLVLWFVLIQLASLLITILIVPITILEYPVTYLRTLFYGAGEFNTIVRQLIKLRKWLLEIDVLGGDIFAGL